MDIVNPFAQMPDAPEPIIALVRRDLTQHDAAAAHLDDGDLDRLAENAVRELWESRVRTFVPILALRQAREVLREREPAMVEPLPAPPIAKTAHVRRSGRDAIAIGNDVLRVDDDVLILGD